MLFQDVPAKNDETQVIVEINNTLYTKSLFQNIKFVSLLDKRKELPKKRKTEFI